ncbi:amino acid/amide ABC transporter ATP-binding protein 2, HAAT family [Roseovarius pacificus]|uniref:Amino acid/amide ABC transporter ATP-binding protein 2, HAAT family n=1 Tax=Roseovarius pacificus TaxID=337701 RepID=A0A1M7B628_9RHOB|nr:ABC transporter ATP-binding protein [Roseovarius pacificus]GGO54712.1 ABC transporter ATP-binding protein [Roseovarius pacificus]SHL50397.1 amino acid/amide ABC transporter ATP-binding protein 2, HAAT family [Roseovarius pacificus]
MLRLEAIDAGYGGGRVLQGFSLDVAAGEIVCLLGRNGAGKTTCMKAIMGLLPLMAGRVMLDGQDIGRLPAHEVPKAGIGYVPQGRRLFAGLSVAQNLEIGLRARGSGRDTLEEVLDLFPRLRERMAQPAQTLSGGEQQMLATARALCLRPKVLLLDEPTEGLQPSMIEAIRQVIVQMRDAGVAVLLVEQRVDAVLSVADRVAFIETGRNGEVMEADALRADHGIVERYVGV